MVSNPSHAKARVLEFLPESVDLGSSNTDEHTGVICESVNENEDILLLQEDGIIISSNYTDFPEKNFVEEILREQFDKSLKHMRFRF